MHTKHLQQQPNKKHRKQRSASSKKLLHFRKLNYSSNQTFFQNPINQWFNVNYPTFTAKQNFLNIFVCKTTKKNLNDPCQKCCCLVDIAYKRALLYVWFPEVKNMFAQIVIDCQTQKEHFSCEYCLVKGTCKLRLEYKVLEKDPSSVIVQFQVIEPEFFV